MKKTAFPHPLFLLLVLWLAIVSLTPRALAAGEEQIFEIAAPVLAATDDLEERLSDGSLHFGSTHLELGCERPGSAEDSRAQLVCIRFDRLQIPPGAKIVSASIQFTAYGESPSGDGFDFTIAAEAAAHSAPLPDETAQDTAYALSSRAVTESVRWASDEENPLPWHTPNAAGEAQQTPDLSALVRQITNRDGWQYGNAISFFFRGTGSRVAFSCENNPAKAAVLRVTYTVRPLLQPAPGSLSATGVTGMDDNDGCILGTTRAMEYRPAKGADWKPCGDGTTGGLSAGRYWVRYAAKPGYASGGIASANVAQYVTDITLQPGADETQMSFTWYSKYRAGRESLVQLAPISAMDGGAFPAGAALTFTGTNRYSSRCLSNSVTVSGLLPGTDYVYRLGDGTGYSKPFFFSTQNPADFAFLFVGDPQIGASGGWRRDARAWQATLDAALGAFPDTAFILSAGDQIESEGNEDQYAGFFSPPQLASVPLVPVIGNHEVWGTHARHFTLPNESDSCGTSMAGGDYWFTYGKVLFMVLNTNTFHPDAHSAFLAEAIAAAGGSIRWKAVAFHHSIYSSGPHADEPIILSWRRVLVPMMDAFGIDVVLMGHDHSYTRTFPMLGGEALCGGDTAANPQGTLYLTANSASGSKYYDLRNVDAAYSAFRWQGYEPSYVRTAVTDNSFSITAYRAADQSVLDRCTLLKQYAP